MNPQETREAEELIFRIRDSGLAVVVIEHDMRFIFNLCDRVLCLVRGKVLVEGTAAEVQSDPRVIEAYIGTPGRPRTPARRPTMLEVKDLVVAYGKVKAVKGITFTVEQGQVVSLLGTNGAGKTTTLRTISGLLRPESGRDLVRGRAASTRCRPTRSCSGAWRTPPRAAGSSRDSPSRTTCCSAPSPARTPPASPRTWSGSSTCSTSSGSAAPSRPARSPAASSRCSRSAGR